MLQSTHETRTMGEDLEVTYGREVTFGRAVTYGEVIFELYLATVSFSDMRSDP